MCTMRKMIQLWNSIPVYVVLLSGWADLFGISPLASAFSCTGDSTCANTIINETGSISCFGYKSCDFSTILLREADEAIFCTGHQSCQDSISMLNNLGEIWCGGYRSCQASNQMIAYNNIIYCFGFYSCFSSTIRNSNELYCRGFFSCSSTTILGIPIINVYGEQSLVGAIVSSQNTVNNTMTIYMYGYKGGSGSTITCYDYHTCYLYCLGNGCENVQLRTNTNSTWVIDCDNTIDKICPDGYYGPSSNPTTIPTTIPTQMPIGGINDTIECLYPYQCQNEQFIGKSINCDGYYSCNCYGGGNNSNCSLTTVSSLVNTCCVYV